MTKAIISIAELLGILVHDHIIVDRNGHASQKSPQLIRHYRERSSQQSSNLSVLKKAVRCGVTVIGTHFYEGDAFGLLNPLRAGPRFQRARSRRRTTRSAWSSSRLANPKRSPPGQRPCPILDNASGLRPATAAAASRSVSLSQSLVCAMRCSPPAIGRMSNRSSKMYFIAAASAVFRAL
jgi:hypothetical protein